MGVPLQVTYDRLQQFVKSQLEVELGKLHFVHLELIDKVGNRDSGSADTPTGLLFRRFNSSIGLGSINITFRVLFIPYQT